MTVDAPVIAAFALGLAGSTHCVLMCGGVVGVLCAGLPAEARSRPLPYLLAYNLGRVGSYTFAGLLAGGLGAIAQGLWPVAGAQLALKAFAGALMLGAGLYLAGVWPLFARVEALGAPLWERIRPAAQALLPVRSPRHAVALGALWGWLPCGLVYAALALALSAGSAPAGALTMLAFGLGTLPMLLAMSAAAGALSSLVRRAPVRRAVGLALGAMGVLSLVATCQQSAAFLHPPSPGAPRAHCHCHQPS